MKPFKYEGRIAPYFARTHEFGGIETAVSAELAELWDAIGAVCDGAFAARCPEALIGRYEAPFLILPRAGEPIDVRRARVLRFLAGISPLTEKTLASFLGDLFGEDGYGFNYEPETYTLTVRIAGDKRARLDVAEILAGALPANIVFTVLPCVTHGEIEAAGKTHADLAAKTHRQITLE